MSASADPDGEIRAIAYRLWEEEGRPDGLEARHWDAAKEIWAARSTGGGATPGTMSVPAGSPDEPAGAATPDGEPALAIENQAIPTALGDQDGTTMAPRRGNSRAGRQPAGR